MPLTSKGKKIMASMKKKYGSKKGEEVFYASKNKGTIEGVEKIKENKMKYIDALNHSVNEAAFLAPLAMGAAKMGAKMLAKKAAVGAAKKMVPGKPKPEEEKDMEESIWNTYKLAATILAEAFAGPIASKYGEKRMKDGGTEKMRDPLVKREAEKTQANVDKKLGTPTNLRAKDAVQGAMNRRRAEKRAKGTGLGSATKKVKGQGAAEQQSDFKKMAGDR